MLILNTTSAGVEKYRVTEPNLYLSKEHQYNIDILEGKINDNIMPSHDIIFTHCNVAQNIEYVSFLKKMKTQGMKIVVDVDDYWVVPHTHSLYQYNKKNNIVKKIVNLLTMADGVTTTTKYLANKIRAYNKNVIVIPNSLDPNKIKINKIASESVRLGWAGGSSHHEDIKLLKNIGIGSKFNARNVQFLLAGFNTNIRTSDNKIIDAFDLSIWKKYEEIITKDYSIVSDGYKQHLLNPNKNKKYFNEDNEKYRRIWTQSIAKYLKIMNEIDIFIVPLANNEFNGLKSELKLIEAGFYRVPVIASSVQQYSDIINH